MRRTRISVCMATFNGDRFVGSQIASILSQLDPDDEVVVSDDSSTDDTIRIIKSFQDPRIKIISANFRNPTKNFENALRQATGDIIFLCDQDDVWLESKVAITLETLEDADLVASDCQIVDENLKLISNSYFNKVEASTGLVRNLIRTSSYVGCCMAFRRNVLMKALPFPPGIPMHDLWIALIAETYFQTKLIRHPLIKYRRHPGVFSNTGDRSPNSLLQKIRIRQSLLAAWTNQITGDAEFRGALTRRVLFVLLTSAVAGALFMPAGFLSVSVILLMLFFLFETTTSGHRPNPVRNKLLLLPPLLFALYSFGLFYSPHQADGLQRMVVKLSLFFIPLGFSFFSGRKRESDLHVVLLAFLTGCLICSFICYGIALETIIETGAFSPEHRERAYFYYSYDLLTEPINFSPVYLSLYCNFGFIVALTSPLLNRRLRVLIACYLAVFILLIASKAGVLALLAIFLIWLIAKRKTQTWWLVTGTVCLTLIALIYLPFLRERFLVPIAFEYSWPFPHQWNSTTERLAIWSCSFETLKGHYFFGYGTGSGQFALQEMFLTKGFVRGTVQSYNPHNEFLTAWLDLGIPGLITMLAMVTIPILVAIRDRNLVALLLMVNCVLFFGVESFLLRQKGVIFFSFFYSLLFWLPNSVPRSPDGQTKGC